MPEIGMLVQKILKLPFNGKNESTNIGALNTDEALLGTFPKYSDVHCIDVTIQLKNTNC